MDSMVPNRAAAALTRPPRFRWFRSSTVNQWAMWSLLACTQSRVSSRPAPDSRRRAAWYTSKAWPPEGARVSTTQILRSGNSTRSSSAARRLF